MCGLDLFVSNSARQPIPVAITATVEPDRRRRGTGVQIAWAWHDGPFGDTLVMASNQGLVGLAFGDPETSALARTYDRGAALANMMGRWPEATYREDRGATRDLAEASFEPRRWSNPIPVHLIGTAFDMAVWARLAAIPVGGTTSYATLAHDLGQPTAARAVGAAVGRNPVSFVIPCHRVLGSAGALTGYHWGIARKRAMLAWEARLAG